MIRIVNGQVTLVLANRQLVTGIVLLVLLMWLFAVATFVVSRVVFPTPVAAVTEPAGTEISSGAPLVSGWQDESSPASSSPTLPSFRPTWFVNAPPGNIYLQAAARDSSAANTFAAYLTANRIPAFTTAGPNGEMSLLLVGPVKDTAHLEALEGALNRELRNAGP